MRRERLLEGRVPTGAGSTYTVSSCWCNHSLQGLDDPSTGNNTRNDSGTEDAIWKGNKVVPRY
jgi:hypothetical protein